MEVICLEKRAKVISVVRKAMPSLRATAMKDFLSALKRDGLYNEKYHSKSENIYFLNGVEVEFFGLDQPHKVRSRRRDILWMNEANEFEQEDWRQLSMRTNKQIFLDYNPSHHFHWLDGVLRRKDCRLIRSTYLDNPFLPEEVVKEIEGYREADENYWRIYGLGLPGISTAQIYSHYDLVDEMPESFDAKIFGLDFGYNHQTAMVEVRDKDSEYWWDEILYRKYLTNNDLILELLKLVADGRLSQDDIIYADNAEPARIEEISRAGFNIRPCVKLKVKDGIDRIKAKKWHITKRSVNLNKEVQTYMWKTKGEEILDEPVKERDHLLDGGRYAQNSYELEQEGKPTIDWL